MSQAKRHRDKKRQLGQFLTPPDVAQRIVAELPFRRTDKVLEPCMGDGSFLLPLIERFMSLHEGSTAERLARVLSENVYGIELDSALYDKCTASIVQRWGPLPST